MHRPDARERLGTNPLSWKTDGAAAPAVLNLGAVFLGNDPRPQPGFVDVQVFRVKDQSRAHRDDHGRREIAR
jgi:hypothetical protein